MLRLAAVLVLLVAAASVVYGFAASFSMNQVVSGVYVFHADEVPTTQLGGPDAQPAAPEAARGSALPVVNTNDVCPEEPEPAGTGGLTDSWGTEGEQPGPEDDPCGEAATTRPRDPVPSEEEPAESDAADDEPVPESATHDPLEAGHSVDEPQDGTTGTEIESREDEPPGATDTGGEPQDASTEPATEGGFPSFTPGTADDGVPDGAAPDGDPLAPAADRGGSSAEGETSTAGS